MPAEKFQNLGFEAEHRSRPRPFCLGKDPDHTALEQAPADIERAPDVGLVSLRGEEKSLEKNSLEAGLRNISNVVMKWTGFFKASETKTGSR